MESTFASFVWHIQAQCTSITSCTIRLYFKGWYMVMDATYKFTIIDAGSYGKQNDDGTFSSSLMF